VPLWTAARVAGGPARLRGMTTDGSTVAVPAAQVRGLGATLVQVAGDAEDAGARLACAVPVAPALRAAVDDFLAAHRAAAGALAGELRWLGATVAAVADSWEALDTALLGAAGRPVPR
jgi:hypothetical protein